MGFHLAATQRAMPATTLTPTAQTAVQDVFLSVSQSGQFMLPRPLRLLAAFAMGDNMTQARVNTAIFREIGLPFISPTADAAAVPSLMPIAYFGMNAPIIPKSDEIIIESTNAAGAPDQQEGLLWVGDGNVNVPPGPIYTLIATASITAGNLVWGNGNFTLTQTLPAGRYAVVGMDVIGANLVAARLVPSDGGMRPGVLARSALTVLPNTLFRAGKMGTFMEFESTSLPSIDLFGVAAPTTQTIFIDVIQIRKGA